MKYFSVIIILCFFMQVQAQQTIHPVANVRLSFLLLPFSPLLTVEFMTVGNLTVQLESNFVNTHGVNLKYFVKERMNGHHLFTGLALVESITLRQDKKITFLPYAGYGYAYRFGNKNQWVFDSRFGIGSTTNADKNAFYPIVKTGIGRIF